MVRKYVGDGRKILVELRKIAEDNSASATDRERALRLLKRYEPTINAFPPKE